MPKYGSHPRNQRYQNWGKTYKACSMAILGAGKALNQIATEELNDVARRFLREQDAQWPHSTQAKSKKSGKTMLFGGDAEHPWYSGQLHDSVAVRIMQKNRITGVHYMPPSPATGEPQHTATIQHIVGAEWAHDIAERHGARYFLPGVQVQQKKPPATSIRLSRRRAWIPRSRLRQIRRRTTRRARPIGVLKRSACRTLVVFPKTNNKFNPKSIQK